MSSAAETSKSAAPIAEGQPDTQQSPVTSKAAVVAPAGQKRSRWKRVAKTSLVVIVLASVIGGYFWKRWDTRSRDRLDQAIAATQAAGLPARFVEIARPQIAPEENFAGPFAQAVALLRPYDALTDEVYGFDNGYIDKPLHPRAGELLASQGPALAALREALKRPRCQFAYDFSSLEPANILLKEIGSVNQFSRALGLECLIAIADGDLPAAYESVITMLQLARACDEEVFFVSWSIRRQTINHGLTLLERVLAQGPPDDATFRRLDGLLTQLEATHRLAYAQASDASSLVTILDNVGSEAFQNQVFLLMQIRESEQSQTASRMDTHLARGRMHIRLRILASTLMEPEVREVQADILETYLQISRLVDEPGPKASQEFARLADAFMARCPEGGPLQVLYETAFLTYAREPAMQVRQRLICARWALRACQYRQAHGQLPDTLQKLVDDQLPQVPLDLLNQQPLVFETRQNGFCLRVKNAASYSVRKTGGIFSNFKDTVRPEIEVTFAPAP